MLDDDDDDSVGVSVGGEFAFEDSVWLPTEGNLLLLTVAIDGVGGGWSFVLFRWLLLLLLLFCRCRYRFRRFVTFIIGSRCVEGFVMGHRRCLVGSCWSSQPNNLTNHFLMAAAPHLFVA